MGINTNNKIAFENFGLRSSTAEENLDNSYDPQQEVEIEKTEDLPPEVKVDLGEDNEIVAFRARAKLYRWVTSTREWKDRGVGEIMIKYNRENNKSRVLMRREQVLKVHISRLFEDCYCTFSVKL